MNKFIVKIGKNIPFVALSYKKLKFLSNFVKFKRLSKINGRFSLDWKEKYPCIGDDTIRTGFDPHYIYHPAWAARILAETKPEFHVDISSSLHFCTLVSAFIPVKFYDYRPAKLNLSGLESEHADITKLDFENNSINSISCMHVVEHIGLGRYGDPLDANGDLKAINELKRVLAKGGNLLFVVPIGKPKIQFNAHRIYSYEQIIEYFSDLKLEEFSLIPDNGLDSGIIYNATKEDADKQTYGCGCFRFTKKI